MSEAQPHIGAPRTKGSPAGRWGGRYTREQNRDFFGRRGQRIAYDMRRQDPGCRRAYLLVTSTMAAARFRAVRPVDTGLAKRVEAYCDEVSGTGSFEGRGMARRAFAEMVQPFLGTFWNGFRYAEIQHHVARGSSGRLRYWLHDLHDCDPLIHDDWIIADDGRTLTHITQTAINGGGEMVERGRLMLVVEGYEAGDYWGEGAYRVARFPQQYKTLIGDTAADLAERVGMGIPAVYTDYKAAADARMDRKDPWITEEQQRVGTQLQQMIMWGESVEEDSNPAMAHSSIVRAELFAAKGVDPLPVDTYWRICDDQILACVLANYLTLGQHEPGARSVGEVHASVMRRAVDTWLDAICRAYARDVLRPLVWLNFGEAGLRAMPRFEHYGLGDDIFAQYLPHVPLLVDRGILTAEEARLLTLRQLRLPARGVPTKDVRVQIAEAISGTEAEPAPADEAQGRAAA